MRCCSCLRNIAAGAEAQKMIVEYQQDDGSVAVHGYMMPGGPISSATGAMLRGWHSRCYWVAKKREAKGNAVTGRVVTGTPTVYDIDKLALTKDDLGALGLTADEAGRQSAGQLHELSTRLRQLRAMAESIGRSVGDPQVQEAFAAAEHGGPYVHHHHHRLETYQLLAHLEYAHGIRDAKLLRTPSGVQDQHAELHAQQNQAIIKYGDFVEPEAPVRDWRTQHTAEI